ncbi:hypothetical protein VP01_116g8 [Puccinia sorghi]|uniref:Uncharacterized protein n=1 Tax=Puccinia sorghi TaxID=27349 RepID=A0A0L6VSS0_9BASI|nr:hypothetical protein VP01_116g8 [Puccinia sorghi]
MTLCDIVVLPVITPTLLGRDKDLLTYMSCFSSDPSPYSTFWSSLAGYIGQPICHIAGAMRLDSIFKSFWEYGGKWPVSALKVRDFYFLQLQTVNKPIQLTVSANCAFLLTISNPTTNTSSRMNWLPRLPPTTSLGFLFLFVITGSTFGFRFGFQDAYSVASQRNNALSESEERAADLKSELEARLQGLLSVEPEREESSCYSHIFGSLNSQEKSTEPEPALCSVLGRSEAHRTAFAARECTHWIQAGSDPASPQLQACVGALHASPQSWSSFTGHQREAVQLCFAHQKLQGIGMFLIHFLLRFFTSRLLAHSLNLKTIRFSTDMIRLGRLDHQSNQEDLRKLRDHVRSLFDQSIQNFQSVSEKNRQEDQQVFYEIENRFKDLRASLDARNEELWREFNAQQNQQINTIQHRVQSLNDNHEVKVNENVNDFLHLIKQEVGQRIQSSLDSAAVRMIEKLKQEFHGVSQSSSANLNHQIKKATALNLASQRHHHALEESITLQSLRMKETQSKLFDELLSAEDSIHSMKQNLDSIQIASNDREGSLRESNSRMEENKRKGEELITSFMASMEIHQAMIQKLSESVSNSPLLMSYSLFKRGDGWISTVLNFVFKNLSFSTFKFLLGWVFWFAWMNGGINWMVKVGVVKTGILLFFLTARMPLRWLRYRITHRRFGKGLEARSVSKDGNKVAPRFESSDWAQELTGQQAYNEQNPEASPLQVLSGCAHSNLHRQMHVRRKFSSQYLGGSRIVPTRLIGSRQHDQTSGC